MPSPHREELWAEHKGAAEEGDDQQKHTRIPNSHWTCKSPQRGDFDSLSNMVRRNRGSLHHSKMRVLLAIHTESLYIDNGVATEGWREALELNEKIDDLLSRASAIGWERREDPNFVRLLDSAFNRPNGPSSVIAYLEVVLDSRMVGGMNVRMRQFACV